MTGFPPFGFTPDYGLEPLLWIGVSLWLYILATNTAWLLQKSSRRPIRRLRYWWQGWRLGPLLYGAVRLLYYLGVPYVALLRGVIGPRHLGLLPVGWETGTRWALGFGGGALLLWGMIWSGYVRTLCHQRRVAVSRPLLERARTKASLWGWPLLMLDALCLEAHWAFIRAGPLLLLNEEYWGVAVGTALIVIESYGNPFIRHGLRQTGQADPILLGATLAVVAAILFYYTHSFWICLAVHFWLELALLVGWRILMSWFAGRSTEAPQPISVQRTG